MGASRASWKTEKGRVMAVSFTVGGAHGTFDEPFADEVACVLDHAFGAEGEWEGTPTRCYGELADTGWSDLQRRAINELGEETIPNLAALGETGRGVYLPAHVQTTSFPLSAGDPLKCASLLGLRNELFELAQRWELPVDDDGLKELLRVAHDPDDGCVADMPEVLTFARLALAANEAMRRDCPLWLVGR
jgi:hypothetical protein